MPLSSSRASTLMAVLVFGSPTLPPADRPHEPAPPARPLAGDPDQRHFPDEDLQQWLFWWAFHREHYLRARAVQRAAAAAAGRGAAAHRDPGPSEQQITGQVLPALKRTLEAAQGRDLVSSCTLAMAKIGRDGGDFSLRGVFAPQLRNPDPEVASTAALALGVAGIADPDSLQLLIDLAGDTAAGHRICDDSPVPATTRAFASYGLGFLAARNDDGDVQRRVWNALKPMLLQPQEREQMVATVHAIGLLHPGRSAADPVLVDAVSKLLDFYRLDLGDEGLLPQAHAPAAVAHLCGRGSDRLATAAKQQFASDLGRNARNEDEGQLFRSCALALGCMCQPFEDPADRSVDADCSRKLLAASRQHADEQTRGFCLLALGQIGGKQNRDALLAAFANRSDYERDWCALALGIAGFERRQQAVDAGREPPHDEAAGQALLAAFRTERGAAARCALAVALGLCHHAEAAADLRALLRSSKNEWEQGTCCEALALLQDRDACADIRAVVAGCMRKPQLLQQAAFALSLLGDPEAVPLLMDMTARAGTNLAAVASTSNSLGAIGDGRCVDLLLRRLDDQKTTELCRAFAAVALGMLCGRGELPWNARLLPAINYRATVPPLMGMGAGILDVL